MFDLKKMKQGQEKVIVRVFYGGEDLEFYAQRPTTDERIQYRRDVRKCLSRRGDTDFEKLSRTLIRWAKRKLIGFREGDLAEDGNPISPSDERWKDMLEEAAPEVLESIGSQLFEGATEVEIENPM